ncbi:unnamed protein product [Amoebophrya sp. A25]|nr:unnamed protein product [Amoebophrya sp. A25]|eukprot:GSA25T00020111001.1
MPLPVLPASMAVKAMASITGAAAAANQTSQYANLAAQNVDLAIDQFNNAMANWESYIYGAPVSSIPAPGRRSPVGQAPLAIIPDQVAVSSMMPLGGPAAATRLGTAMLSVMSALWRTLEGKHILEDEEDEEGAVLLFAHELLDTNKEPASSDEDGALSCSTREISETSQKQKGRIYPVRAFRRRAAKALSDSHAADDGATADNFLSNCYIVQVSCNQFYRKVKDLSSHENIYDIHKNNTLVSDADASYNSFF